MNRRIFNAFVRCLLNAMCLSELFVNLIKHILSFSLQKNLNVSTLFLTFVIETCFRLSLRCNIDGML